MLYHPFGEEQTACVLSKLVLKLVEKSLLLDNILAVLAKHADFRTLDLGESLLDLCHDKATELLLVFWRQGQVRKVLMIYAALPETRGGRHVAPLVFITLKVCSWSIPHALVHNSALVFSIDARLIPSDQSLPSVIFGQWGSSQTLNIDCWSFLKPWAILDLRLRERCRYVWLWLDKFQVDFSLVPADDRPLPLHSKVIFDN